MTRATVLAVTLAILGSGATSAEASIDWKREHWDGSRTTPVHVFPMYDETGQQIVPTYDQAMPMSQRNTCGTCHNYSTVSAGWHFNSSKGNVAPGRPGEPWVIVDKATGTQLPVSYRGWPGMWDPEALGISQWEFTKRFSRHMPGGDFAEPAGDVPEDPHARWEISGKLEVNCLACHNGSNVQDHSEWALQTQRENFRWAGTAAAHLGNVNGMASRMRESWIIGDGPNPDDNEFAVAPSVDYHDHQFDDRNRTVFDVRHKPPDQNCLQCHSASPVATTRWAVSEDVHSALGIGCADCHRNGLDHMIIRGYETEAKERGKDPHVGAFSCAGCHIGNAAGVETAAGRMGGPIPAHAGIPPVHFEKMECTACHSGPMPDHKLHRVRLSRANRLGIHGRAQWFTDAPYIVEPVFVRGESGKIAPHRMMWPAFWAKMDGDKLKPLMPEEVAKAGLGILDVEQQIDQVLQAIAQNADIEGTAVLVMKDQMFWRGRSGGLEFAKYETSQPVAMMWGRETSGTVHQLVTAFDPTVEELDSSIQTQMQKTLDVMGRGMASTPPAFHAGNKLYLLDESANVTTTATAEKAEGLQLVKLIDGKPEPMVPLERAQSFAETAGTEYSMDEKTVVEMLRRLTASSEDKAQFAYVSNGKGFKLNEHEEPGYSDGEIALQDFDHDAAKPVSWPFGHDVRPAAQSLGAKSCQECHSEEAAYLFAGVMPTGPLKTGFAVSTPMYEFQKLDGNFQELFGLSFKVRSAFKVGMYVVAGVLALLLLAFGILGLRRLTKYVSARS